MKSGELWNGGGGEKRHDELCGWNVHFLNSAQETQTHTANEDSVCGEVPQLNSNTVMHALYYVYMLMHDACNVRAERRATTPSHTHFCHAFLSFYSALVMCHCRRIDEYI